jgi:sulfate transport system ATP-binding protein
MQLHLQRLAKRYPGVSALDGVDLDIASGELVALLGPSGSGKTTLLRVIAGLLGPDDGRVLFGDTDATRLSLRERNVGFVFQHYALFRHMTVAENIAFGLRSRPRARRPDKATIARRVRELLQLIQLPEHGERYPEQLSGGQKQRVALARALAIDPSVLLLDEPFGALDAKVRFELRSWLRRLHDETGFTTVFVTHDQEEALELADRVVVMNQGRIEQDDTPDRVYASPASAFVFDFLGRSNCIAGTVSGGRFTAPGFVAPVPAEGCAEGAAQLFTRPHDLRIANGHPKVLEAKVEAVHRLAGRTSFEATLDGQSRPLLIDIAGTELPHLPQRGESVALALDHYRVFAADHQSVGR